MIILPILVWYCELDVSKKMWTHPLQLLQTQSGTLGVEVFSVGKENSHKWPGACFDSVWLLSLLHQRFNFWWWYETRHEKSNLKNDHGAQKEYRGEADWGWKKKTVLDWTACGLATEMYTPLGDWNLPGDCPVTGRMGAMVMTPMKEFSSLSLGKMLNIKMVNLSTPETRDYTLRLGDGKDSENPTG